MIIAGGSASPRHLDFATFRAIADEVGAYLMVDMAHFAGLVAAGVHPSPFPHAHIVTTTTHKTLRGPRGGMILTNDEAIAKKVNSAIFPGLQGGPLMHVIAGKAVAFGEALTPAFKTYSASVVENAKTLAATLVGHGLGTPAATTRGFGVAEFTKVGDLIAEVLDGLAANPEDNGAVEARVREEVKALCDAFPIYPGL